jgi:hypothetical protein
MLRNKSIFQISTLICLSSISICNLLTYPRIKLCKAHNLLICKGLKKKVKGVALLAHTYYSYKSITV